MLDCLKRLRQVEIPPPSRRPFIVTQHTTPRGWYNHAIVDTLLPVLHHGLRLVILPWSVTCLTSHTVLPGDLVCGLCFSKVIRRYMTFQTLAALLRVLNAEFRTYLPGVGSSKDLKGMSMRAAHPLIELIPFFRLSMAHCTAFCAYVLCRVSVRSSLISPRMRTCWIQCRTRKFRYRILG